MTIDAHLDRVIRVEELCKSYSETVALDRVSFSVGQGEFFCIIGPSGSGKSTLLRILAGVEGYESGTLHTPSRQEHKISRTSDVVLVWQSLALFPHLNVEKNIGFGLRMRRIEKTIRKARVSECMEQLSLNGLGDRRVDTLSGGERQRVALARALVLQPRVLLLDEPFGSLDRHLRMDLQSLLRSLHRETNLTIVMVTHDQAHCLALASRIGVLFSGRLEQVGTPSEILEKPRSGLVARFVGRRNVFRGKIRGQDRTAVHVTIGDALEASARSADGEHWRAGDAVDYVVDVANVRVGVRGQVSFEGDIRGYEVNGALITGWVDVPGLGEITADVVRAGGSENPFAGHRSIVSWSSDDAYVIPRRAAEASGGDCAVQS